jgi:hypothetical protein
MAKQQISSFRKKPIIENFNGKIVKTKHQQIYNAWIDFCALLPAHEKHMVRIHGGFVRDTLADKSNKVSDIDFVIDNENIAKSFFDFLNERKLVNPRKFGRKQTCPNEGYVQVATNVMNFATKAA